MASDEFAPSQLLGATAYWTAAVRAAENQREDRLFEDPWAAALAGEAGAPWLGTMDDPVGFLAARGWQASLSQAGQPEANHGRWPFPVIPTNMPQMPHNWFVTARCAR